MLVSFLGFCALPGDPGGEGAPTSTRCRLWFGCCAAGRGLVPYCGVRVGKPSVKQLCNPLDADQGAPHSRRGPADWLDAGTRDRHVAVLAQPAWVSLETEWRCCWARKWGRCWSYDGPACCGAGGRGRRFSLALSETGGLSLAQGPLPHAKPGGRGVSPLPLYCSTGDGFPVLLIQGFWQKRKKGGG